MSNIMLSVVLTIIATFKAKITAFEQKIVLQQRKVFIKQFQQKTDNNFYVEENGEISCKKIFHDQRKAQKGLCAWDGQPLGQVNEIYRFEHHPSLFLLCRNQTNRDKLKDPTTRSQAFYAQEAAIRLAKTHNFGNYNQEIQTHIKSFYSLQGSNSLQNLQKFYSDFQTHSHYKLGDKTKRKYKFIIRQASKQKKGCIWCNKTMDFGNANSLDKATIEHLIPRSKQGPNHQANLALACSQCNNSRGDIELQEWIIHCQSQGYKPQVELIQEQLKKLPYKYIHMIERQFVKKT